MPKEEEEGLPCADAKLQEASEYSVIGPLMLKAYQLDITKYHNLVTTLLCAHINLV